MIQNNIIRSLFIFLTASFLSGCASVYVSPDKPHNQLAYVSETAYEGNAVLNINYIDGNITHTFKEISFENVNDGKEVFTLEPGIHELSLYYNESLRYAHGDIKFNAEAGKKYHLECSIHAPKSWLASDAITFFVVDTSTGKPINITE